MMSALGRIGGGNTSCFSKGPGVFGWFHRRADSGSADSRLTTARIGGVHSECPAPSCSDGEEIPRGWSPAPPCSRINQQVGRNPIIKSSAPVFFCSFNGIAPNPLFARRGKIPFRCRGGATKMGRSQRHCKANFSSAQRRPPGAGRNAHSIRTTEGASSPSILRTSVASSWGVAPKKRLNSRLNCEAL
jgi:hypothetical protein